jgi:aspartyl aminopeptidase
MADPTTDDTRDLLDFLDNSPSPFHAVATVVARLEAAGFTAVDEREAWSGGGRHHVVRGGTVVAWTAADALQLDGGFRIIGAHTDSPNLRVKPNADTGRAGYRQLGVEVYGGALWNSWLDRDLGLSGRVSVRGQDDPLLVKVDRPLLRVPQLAIHLDRAVNETGLKLNPQQHLVPIWGMGRADEGGFTAFLAAELGVAPADIQAWDLMLHDLTPAALLGRKNELLSSARIDNLVSCWAATTALLGAGEPNDHVGVICLFDHEEIGSESATGAAGSILPTVLERISLAPGRDRQDHLRSLAASRCVSADGAHATHPNYPERHEPEHLITPNAGPVVKTNTNVRYATDAASAAWFQDLCDGAGVPTQQFVVRSDMPCGSTIGPITSARLGISTVDVGVAQLSMHSARELCGAQDPALFVRALTPFVAGD